MEKLEIKKDNALIEIGLVDKDIEVGFEIEDFEDDKINMIWLNKTNLIKLSKHINNLIKQM